jgi:hypothetical protein
MAADGSAEQPDNEEVRRRDLFNVDELINVLMSKAQSRAGRRVITAACFVVVSAIVVYPIMTRSSPAPAGQADLSTLTFSVPTIPKSSAPPTYTQEPVDIVDPGGHRFGPPLPTDGTTATASPATTTTTLPAATTPPVVPPTQPAVTSPPATEPPPPPPPTSPPDTGVVVPYP